VRPVFSSCDVRRALLQPDIKKLLLLLDWWYGVPGGGGGAGDWHIGDAIIEAAEELSAKFARSRSGSLGGG
jgi:hypothetical protein|tara:strand:+ start:854 stop:1066 length:213 start_codon:yes stop_codon:yes gene_type:complete